MPELPDLQAYAKNLDKLFKGKELKNIKVPVTKKLNVSIPDLEKALIGRTVKSIRRSGKEIHIEFDNKHVLGLHLMLHGQFNLFEEKNGQKFAIVELLFEDGKGLALSDFQKAATPTLDPEENNTPDASGVTHQYLQTKLSATRKPIKTVLLDQKVLRGIGNAYADEILYDAGISPFSFADKLPLEQVKKLVNSIMSVLANAEKEILEAQPDIINGEVRDFFRVHLPRKKETPKGEIINQKPIGGRKTYYTDTQELFE